MADKILIIENLKIRITKIEIKSNNKNESTEHPLTSDTFYIKTLVKSHV